MNLLYSLGTPACPQWGEALQVSDVPQELHPVGPPAEAPASPHRREAPPM